MQLYRIVGRPEPGAPWSVQVWSPGQDAKQVEIEQKEAQAIADALNDAYGDDTWHIEAV